MIRAAGILFIAGDKVLLVQRSANGDHEGEWSIPGGKIEDGETPEEAAIRECREELGTCPDGERAIFARRKKDNVDYTTYLQRVKGTFSPSLNDEHQGFMWAPIGEWPSPLHPGCKVALDKLTMDELQIAKAIVRGDLTSPQYYFNIAMFAVRITGTGVAYRMGLDEYVYRRPEIFLTDDFVERCVGLTIVWEHPETNSLTSDEYADRVVGTIILPYISNGEVWGIAKIYDDTAKTIMENEQVSTSPTVVFKNNKNNKTIKLENGDKVLVEGKPDLLDHLAICEQGVWDKARNPSGVVSVTMTDANESEKRMDENMPAPEMTAADKARKDGEGEIEKKEMEEKEKTARMDADGGEKLDRILKHLDSMHARMDAMEAKFAKKDSEETEEKKNVPGNAPSPSKMDAKKDGEAESEVEKDRKESERDEAAELRKRMDAAEREVKEIKDSAKEIPEAEQNEYTDAQSRADSVAQVFGKQAPRPMRGERLIPYRKRMLEPYRKYSDKWKNVELGLMSKQILDIAEAEIYADAMKAGLQPTDLPPGKFREVTRVDPYTNQRVTTFHGTGTFFKQLGARPRRVTHIGARKENY